MSEGSGSGLTRGDRRRNARVGRLRLLVPAANAVLGVDLGEKKQAVALVEGDGRVLARRSPRAGVHGLGGVLDWAAEQARAAGFAGMTVACEPAGSRWMVLQELCRVRGLPFVCVQPLVTHVAREQHRHRGHHARSAHPKEPPLGALSSRGRGSCWSGAAGRCGSG